jgi:hypothetical protein
LEFKGSIVQIIHQLNTIVMRLTTMFGSTLVAACMIIGTAYTPVNNVVKAKGDWFFLGDKKVGFGVDHDVINFGNWRDDVRQIKLKVTDGPLRMYRMLVHFDNGSTQEVALRNNFAQGSESRVIDMDGGLRHLSQIEFWYETKGFIKGRARVAAWGRN